MEVDYDRSTKNQLKDLTHLKRFDCIERFGDFENDSREAYLMSVFIVVWQERDKDDFPA